MTFEPSSVIIGVLCSTVPSLFGWLLVRSVKAVDKSLADLTKKVDKQAQQDTQILIQLAELRTRVTHLEFLVRREHKVSE